MEILFNSYLEAKRKGAIKMKLKCEKCGGAIQYDKCLDLEHCGHYDDTIVGVYGGHCCKCKTKYTWIEEYKYHKRRNLEMNKN